jgi:hypothetical protein
VILLDPEDTVVVTFEWDDAIPSTSPLTTLVSVAHTAPSASPTTLILQGESTDVTAKTSAAKVSGGVHGETYLLTAAATLSNGEVVNRSAVLRCIQASS